MRAAAAQIAAHPLAEFIPVERDDLARQILGHMARQTTTDLTLHADRRANLPRRTIAALETIMFDEGLLKRVRPIGRKPLDCLHGLALELHRKSEARQKPLAIHQDGTRAASTLIAALFRSRQLQMFAQEVQQRNTRIGWKRFFSSIHGYGHELVLADESFGPADALKRKSHTGLYQQRPEQWRVPYPDGELRGGRPQQPVATLSL